jgi:hypothetical protein
MSLIYGKRYRNVAKSNIRENQQPARKSAEGLLKSSESSAVAQNDGQWRREIARCQGLM